MYCEERESLTSIYVAVLQNHACMRLTVPDVGTKAWQEATRETRLPCGEALKALYEHRTDHGC
jgi:hypothetical protein